MQTVRISPKHDRQLPKEAFARLGLISGMILEQANYILSPEASRRFSSDDALDDYAAMRHDPFF